MARIKNALYPCVFRRLDSIPVQPKRLIAQNVCGDEEHLLRAVESLAQARWLGKAGLLHTDPFSSEVRSLLRIADTHPDLRCRQSGQQTLDNPAPVVPCCSCDHDHASLPPAVFNGNKLCFLNPELYLSMYADPQPGAESQAAQQAGCHHDGHPSRSEF